MKYGFAGLSRDQVLLSRSTHGSNKVEGRKKGFLRRLKDFLKDPMLLLLLAAALLYFISGQTGDALFMTAAIVFVAGISFYQESRSQNALAALKEVSRPFCKVIRDGDVASIPREEIVVGDYMLVEEGNFIPADGTIVHSNDFSVNEATLTGESLSVSKNKDSGNNKVYDGTVVTGGLAICVVDGIGMNSELGKIGRSIEAVEVEETPLQKQIRSFVNRMAIAGIVVFIVVWLINYIQSNAIVDSLLKALTLAMSILPEEIPVAFTAFMALGAWRLMKLGVIVRQTKTVEALGSATVICTDKTGTITENRMSIVKIFDLSVGSVQSFERSLKNESDVITFGMWASEPIPFDPMEIALHEAYAERATRDERKDYRMIHEYPLDGRPPMMTHVFRNNSGHTIIAAKGAPEAIVNVSALSESEKSAIDQAFNELTKEGYRVLAVAVTEHPDDHFPATQQEFKFTLKGLVAFYDPPKKNIVHVFESFYNAGIGIKIITGDNSATTLTIAKQVNFRGTDAIMDGAELLKTNDEQLKKKVMEVNLFTRMFPEAKLRILNALKSNGEIVAMTGDGVNDGPALKAAHIGIAMGKRGSEIAREVSSLILTDDDLSRMVDAIAMGRKIYENLKKAIQYIISIHIPIILTVLLPLALGWKYPSIFTPVHIIFLELIMGPTCSIIYENEPMETGTMSRKPRPFSSTFFNMHELATSIIQGLAITLGVLSVYQFSVSTGNSEAVTRALIFLTLIAANIFLTLGNRSFYFSVFYTLRYKNPLVLIIISITVALTAAIILIPILRSFFGFAPMTFQQMLIAIAAGVLSVVWYEFVKLGKRLKGLPGKV